MIYGAMWASSPTAMGGRLSDSLIFFVHMTVKFCVCYLQIADIVIYFIMYNYILRLGDFLMKKFARILSIVLSALLILSVLPLGIFSAVAETTGETGDCTWTLSGTTLAITGNGEMADYDPWGDSMAPWGTDITAVIIGHGVTYVGSYAFYDCNALESVNIGSGLEFFGLDAFAYCTALSEIVVDSQNPYYISSGNCLIEKDTNVLVLGCKNSVIPTDGSVTSIGVCAFQYCTGLKSITIPDGVDRIGSCAFFGCSALSTVNIADSVTSIGSSAFSGTSWYSGKSSGIVYAGKVAYAYKGICPSSLTVADGTLGIAESAFCDNSAITTLTIPDSVISIGENAFYDTAWYNAQPDGIVYAGKVAYSIKGEPISAVSLSDGTLGIADGALSNGVQIVYLPASVKSIGADAFSYDLSRICYGGTAEEWSLISIDRNSGIIDATSITFELVRTDFENMLPTALTVENYSVIEGVNGYLDDEDFYYFIAPENFTLTFGDGTQLSSNGSNGILVNGDWYYISVSDNQYDSPWTAGNTYTVTASVLGVSDEFEVTVIPSPVTALAVDDVTVYEGIDDIVPTFTVTLQGGATVTSSQGYVCIDGQYVALSYCYEGELTAGSATVATASLGLITDEFSITVLENPVTAIEMISLPKDTYGAYECFNINGTVVRVHFNDSSYEDVTVSIDAVDYGKTYVEKLGKAFDILGYITDNDEAEIQFLGLSCTKKIERSTLTVTAVEYGENSKKQPVLTLTYSDNSTLDVTVFDLLAGGGSDPSAEYKYTECGVMLTDAGSFSYVAQIDNDDKLSFGVPAAGSDEYVYTDKISDYGWFKLKMQNSSIVESILSYSPAGHFSGTITAKNIDEVINIAIDKQGIRTVEHTYAAAVISQAVLDTFGLTVDLTLSENYNTSTEIYTADAVISDPIDFGTSEIAYSSSRWVSSTVTGEHTVYVMYDDKLQIICYAFDHIPGDITDDGKVNSADLTRLLRYLNDWDVETNEAALDVTGDGKINSADLTRLLRYLNDWPVEIY